MPRRNIPVKSRAVAGLDMSVPAKVQAIAQRYGELARLPNEKRDTLIAALVDAIGFARAGLADILAGKRAKPAAWTMDILVKDVCDALRATGVAAPMATRRAESLAQILAGDLAALAGIPVKGQLFKQMQRARRLEKSGGVTCPPKPVLILGRWQVLGNKASIP
jgi:hypothetical protein